MYSRRGCLPHRNKNIFTESKELHRMKKKILKLSTPLTKTGVQNTFHKRLKLYVYKIQITGNLRRQQKTHISRQTNEYEHLLRQAFFTN